MDEGLQYNEETFRKGLNREDTLEGQIRNIVFFYSRMKWHEFEYSLKALFPLLPSPVREHFEILKHDVSVTGVEKHFKQFMEVQSFLESDTNMVWKKRFIKTYE
ncbi:MAG: hypothetical protein DRN27_09950 [Thermoplasmata archaeon]|nr:MAG: hypothetical protein DRN27_09950 [Thermoplasmata archaeon]